MTAWPQKNGRQEVPRKQSTAVQIISKLREAELQLARGRRVAQVVKKLGVTEQTYYRWPKEYGDLRMGRAKRLKELEKENARLKNLVAIFRRTGGSPVVVVEAAACPAERCGMGCLGKSGGCNRVQSIAGQFLGRRRSAQSPCSTGPRCKPK